MDYVGNGIKIIFIMAFLLLLVLITGRRKIAELPAFDFLILITLGSVVGSFIFDPAGKLLHIIFALVVLVSMHYIYSLTVLKNRKAGRLLTFEPVVVIENGQFVKSNLKKLSYTIDNILSMLREKDVFDMEEVEFAVVEPSGKLSVLKKTQFQPVTAKEIMLDTKYRGLSYPLIVEGKVYEDNLRKMNLDRKWLILQLKSKGIASENEVFFAAANTEHSLYVSTGHDVNSDPPELRH